MATEMFVNILLTCPRQAPSDYLARDHRRCSGLFYAH